MAERILLQRKMNVLAAGDDDALAVIQAMKHGDAVYCEIKRARSPRQHRLYWALCNIVAENTDRYENAEHVSDMLKCAVGHCRVGEGLNGTKVYVPKSISFANMGQDKFNAFFDRIVKLVCEKVIPGMDEGELRRELEQMVGIYETL